MSQFSIAFISNNPDQFCWCKHCNCFNHIENVSCHNCGSKDLDAKALGEQVKNEREFLIYSKGATEETLRETFYTTK